MWWLLEVLALSACSSSATPAGNDMNGGSGASGQLGGPSSTCPELGRIYPVGKPAPSEVDPGQSVVDGEGGTTISCSVRGTGPYSFSGVCTSGVAPSVSTLVFEDCDGSAI